MRRYYHYDGIHYNDLPSHEISIGNPKSNPIFKIFINTIFTETRFGRSAQTQEAKSDFWPINIGLTLL
jgi:hypothetical protein